MLEISRVADYGAYSQNRQTADRQENEDVTFGDYFTGFEETSGKSETGWVSNERKSGFTDDSAVEVVTYNHGARILMYSSNLGVNLDILL